MKHIKKFNESKRDEVRDEISSTFKASGNLVKHEQEIKDENFDSLHGQQLPEPDGTRLFAVI